MTNIDLIIKDAGTAATAGADWSGLTIEQRISVAENLGRVRTAIAQLDDAKKALEEILRTKPVGEDEEEVAGFKVSTSPNRTFEKGAFAIDYPVSRYPSLYKQEVDLAAIKKVVAPADLDLYYKDGEAPRLNFKAS